MDLVFVFIMCLRGLVLFTLFVPGAARRSIRIDHSAHDAQQRNNALTKALEVSAEAREALLPGGFGTALLRRRAPQAGALPTTHEQGPQVHAPHGQGSRLPPQGSPVLEQYGRRAGHLEPHRAAPWLHARQRHPAVALHAARNLEDPSSDAASPGPVEFGSADSVTQYVGSSRATGPLRRALDSLGPVGYLTATASQRREINGLLTQLESTGEALNGDWELLYTDAPDITDLANSGPFVQVSRIVQSIDGEAGTIANVIEYVPRGWLPERGDGDRLQNRILLKYDIDESSQLNLPGALSVPFGSLECVYSDGDLRVYHAQQGYFIVIKALAQGEDLSSNTTSPGPVASESDADPAADPLRRALGSLGPVGYLTATAGQREAIDVLLKQFLRTADSLDGDWVVLYTDAPEIKALDNSGPLLQVSRIGQSIDAAAGTIETVIEYVPREWVPGREDGDRLQSRVLLDYDVDPARGREVIQKLTGLKIIPKTRRRQIAGFNLPEAPPLNLQGPLSLPLGNLECVYSDIDLRVFRTWQRHWIVILRLAQDEGWDA